MANTSLIPQRPEISLTEAMAFAGCSAEDLFHQAEIGNLTISAKAHEWDVGSIRSIDHSKAVNLEITRSESLDTIVGNLTLHHREGQFGFLYKTQLTGLLPISPGTFKDYKIDSEHALVRTPTVAIANDLSKATNDYKNKFRSLPGDDPTASTEISGIAISQNGDGNGQIDLLEVMNASAHLFAAGYIKGGPGNLVTAAPFVSPFGRVWLISSLIARGGNSPCAGGTPVNASPPISNSRNQILYENLPGDVAMAVDSKLDDGLFNSGSVRGSAAYNSNTINACLAIDLN